MVEDEEVFNLCKRIFQKDKTPAYGYDRNEADEDKCGNLPKKGKRWLTLSEMILDFVEGHLPDRKEGLWE